MDNFKYEEWKDIPNFEGYQVSNLGRIRSLPRQTNNQFGKKERILKPWINRNGYYLIGLYKQSIRKEYSVHRLVYEAFNGSIPEGLQVNHINEIKTDNRLSNLNLMTPKENINFGTHNERVAKKMTNGKLSKPVLQIDLEGNVIKEWKSTMQAERESNNFYKNQNISSCCNGKLKTYKGYKWEYKKDDA